MVNTAKSVQIVQKPKKKVQIQLESSCSDEEDSNPISLEEHLRRQKFAKEAMKRRTTIAYRQRGRLITLAEMKFLFETAWKSIKHQREGLEDGEECDSDEEKEVLKE